MRQFVRRHPTGFYVDALRVRGHREGEGTGDTAEQQARLARGAQRMARLVGNDAVGAAV